jgi:hypothetical protein
VRFHYPAKDFSQDLNLPGPVGTTHG